MPTLLAYYIHQLSPFIVQFSDRFGLHWYGFAYVMAFVLGYWAYHYLARRGYGEMPPEKVADFITFAAIFGVMLGGRVGWILFYGWDVVPRASGSTPSNSGKAAWRVTAASWDW